MTIEYALLTALLATAIVAASTLIPDTSTWMPTLVASPATDTVVHVEVPECKEVLQCLVKF